MDEIRTLYSYYESLYAIAVSSDGKWIASGSRDGRVIVWGCDTGKIEQQMSIGNLVNALAFSPDAELLVAGTGDGTVVICDAACTKRLCTLQMAALESLAFRPGTHELMVGGANGRMYQCEVPSGRVVRELTLAPRQILSMSFSSDGATLLAASGAGTLTFLETGSWTVIRSYALPCSNPVFYRAVLSPNGQLCLASLAYRGTDSGGMVERHEILVWDLEREEQPTLDGTLVGHLAWTGALDYAPQHDLVASGSFDETVMIWDRRHRVLMA